MNGELKKKCDQVNGMEDMLEWWEANPNSIVALEPSLLESISTSKETAAAVGVSVRTLQRWKTGSRRPLLSALIRLADALKMKKSGLNDKIISLASFKGEKTWHAKFPINESPCHAGIIAHGFFDGNECCGVLVYGTLTKEENDDFARLVRESGLDTHLLDYSRDRKGLPASATRLLKNHYGIATFLSDRCIFSEKLMSLAARDGEYRKEILRAAFLDEGHVTLKNGICAFGIKNGRLTQQVCSLLDAGGYQHWSAQTPSETQVYLRFDSCEKFYSDILSDMPGAYRKKIRIVELLAKLRRIRATREERFETMRKILAMAQKSGKIPLSGIYAAFEVKHSNKKTFYDRHIRRLKKMRLIEMITQGDMTWVRVPESGKPESFGFGPTKRRGECAGNG